MEKKKYKIYKSPSLTVIPIKTERGYAASSGTTFDEILLWDKLNMPDDPQTEDYTTGNSWSENTDNFWN